MQAAPSIPRLSCVSLGKRAFVALGLALLVASLASAPAVAQEPVTPILSGRLERAGVPADSGTVVLHRIGPAEAAAIDSTRVGAGGEFAFRLPGLPAPDGDVYFLTSAFEGVRYYSPGPISLPVQLDSGQVLTVYPTEPAPAEGLQFPILLRELTLAEGPLGWEVTDAFILQNELQLTFVAEGESSSVWSYPVPEGAIAPRVIVQEVWPPGPVRLEEGRIRAANPVVPGTASYMLQYDVATLPFEVPMPGSVLNARIFLREPGPEIRVEGMAARGPVEVEGTAFRAWEAVNLQDQTIRVMLGSEGGRPAVSLWLTALLAIVLVGVGTWVMSRRPEKVPTGGSRVRKEILMEIARLDEAFQGGATAEEEAGRYRERRTELLRELEESGTPGGR